ncbi:MAG TPA: HDOD domain-containing protein [Acidobacteriota bacterium]|nr:HDOD domain-containing protein [Acidobacteriota bacterium]
MTQACTDNDRSLNLSALVAGIRDLPPLPATVARIMEATFDHDISIRNLYLLISQDQALSAKILKIVNSAMYALRCEVSTVSRAVSILGLDTVKSIIMAASIERVFYGSTGLSAKLLSDHSWGTAIAARAIARTVRYENLEEALICGLMHDIGKPVLMHNARERYMEIVSDVYLGDATFYEREIASFGFSHAEVGALLARKWNFPAHLAEAIGFHHDPLSAPTYKKFASIINLANLVMIAAGIGFEKNSEIVLEKQPSAEMLQLAGPAIATLVSESAVMFQATAGLRI